MRINFDFTDLQAFLAVIDTGSFHHAADRLNMSQPSITRRIRKLEEALGAVLFERTTRTVRPTLAARRLKVSAEAMLDNAAETTRALRDETQAHAYQRAQVLTVAAIPTVMRQVLVPAIRALRDDYPGARVRVLDRAANEVAEAVAEGEADLGISSVALHDPATRFETLFEDPVVLAMPTTHRLAARETLRWRDLGGAALILPARGTGNRLLIDDALARTSDNVRWTFEVQRTTTALSLVEAGIGIAPLPRIALQGTSAPGVVWRPVTDPGISRPIGLLTRTAQSLTGLTTRLRAALIAASRVSGGAA